jgi:hypothetical protein
MKYIFATLFLSFSLLLINSFAQEDNIRRGELLVQFRPEIDEDVYFSTFNDYGVEKIQLLSDLMNIWWVKYEVDIIPDQEFLGLTRAHHAVLDAQFNHVVQLRGSDDLIEETMGVLNSLSTFPNDPRFNEQWGLHNTGQTGGVPDADIDAPEAWDFTTGGLTALGDTIVVAIVDGGMDLNHNDLNYWFNWGEIPGNGIDDDGNGYIDDYRGWNAYNNNGNVPSSSHGTHVGGIAGAKGDNNLGVSGVNWNVKVMPIAGSSSNEATVIAAYGYALKMRWLYNQTNGLEGAFIVATNASFGVDQGQPSNYPLWCAIYDSLGIQGVLSTGATANANWDIDVVGDVPTACPSPWLISVTNTTHNDVKNTGAAYGATTIDLGAPGTSILSTDLSNTYTLKTGTSMATPMVTGAIALMFGAANSGIMGSYKSDPSGGAIVFRDFLFSGTDPIPSLQGITVTGGRLNVFNAILPLLSPPDTIPPTTVTDLAVIEPTSNSLTLTWTAPLDTSQNGVMAYDIRMDLAPIIDTTTFNNAQPITFPGSPAPAGSTETLLVDGLEFNTTYYFALRANDLWNNISEISNSPAGTTFDAPVVSVNPSSVHFTLVNDTIETATVSLSNISVNNSTLDYEVTLENNTFPEGMVGWRAIPLDPGIELGDDEKDNPTIHYGQSIDGSGGPDEFGYEWIDSNEPNGPQYVWEDIVSTGTLVENWVPTGTWDPKDEGFAGPFPLGFTFKFYGIEKTEIYVASNGFFHFSPLTANTITNASIPNTAHPNDYIAPFWDDLDGRTQGTVHYKQDGNRFIMQFTNWQKYSGQGSLTFQVVLYSSGKIMYYYNDMVGTLNSATVGIENGDGTIGLQVAYNSTYVENNLAVKISAEPDWLSADPISGTLYNGNSVDLELTFRTEDFPLGDYSMDMVINSNDPANPTLVVPVTMTIVIPVELTSLTAESDRNNVTLLWSTATETNNQGFEIERINSELKMQNGSWQKVGFVEGRGTTTESQRYSFNDNNLGVGKFTYRLKQIDFDGTYEYSPEVEIEVSTPDEYALMQNYPNPFNPATTIEYTLPEIADVRIDVYNVLGELITTLINREVDAGYQTVKFDAASLPSGIYIYRLNAEGKQKSFTDTKKMLLVK